MTKSDDIDNAFGQVSAVEGGFKRTATRLMRVPVPSPAAVRFHLTQWIIGSFIVYATAVGVFIMFSGEKEKFTILLEILKTLFLPLVTLVIGHYFGSKT